MSRCDQCQAILGSKIIGPGIPLLVAHRSIELCRGCAVSIAMAICLNIRKTSVVQQRTIQQGMDDSDWRELARGMK